MRVLKISPLPNQDEYKERFNPDCPFIRLTEIYSPWLNVRCVWVDKQGAADIIGGASDISSFKPSYTATRYMMGSLGVYANYTATRTDGAGNRRPYPVRVHRPHALRSGNSLPRRLPRRFHRCLWRNPWQHENHCINGPLGAGR